MGKVVCGVFMAIGIVIILVAHPRAWVRVGIDFDDPLAFEREAYRYLGFFVGSAFILLGLVLGAVISLLPPRKPKTLPPPPFDDMASRPSNEEL